MFMDVSVLLFERLSGGVAPSELVWTHQRRQHVDGDGDRADGVDDLDEHDQIRRSRAA
jgi:hypothetical protein